MTWVRMDDGYPEHPKVDRVGPLASWLNVCAWAYCARNLTDGFVPEGRVQRLADVPNPQQLAGLLVEVGLWEKVEGGYMVHDYLDYNPSREQVLRERAANAKRVNAWREKQGSPENGNGGGNAITDRPGNGVSNAVGDGVRTDAPYPAPSPPVNNPVTTANAVAVDAHARAHEEFSIAEREVIQEVTEALAPFAFKLTPGCWRTVLERYHGLSLDLEAHKQADWLKRKRIRTCSAARYTNWLAKALEEQREKGVPVHIVSDNCDCEYIRQCDERGAKNGPRQCPQHGYIPAPWRVARRQPEEVTA